MQHTYYTTDFEPIQPTGHVAFTSAYNSKQAVKKLRQAIIDTGCEDPGESFDVKRLLPGKSYVVHGDY